MRASFLNIFLSRIVFQTGLMGYFAVLTSLPPAFGGPLPGSASGAASPSPFFNVNLLGEPTKLASQREGHLFSHLRTTDPFGITIRGPFKGLPPVVEHPPEQPNLPTAAPAPTPTLELAVKALPIGGVDASRREILIGSRSVHEGDLLVLESQGRKWVVWVQSVEEHGVVFCDIDLQKHVLKPVGSAPKELPVASVPKELPRNPADGIPDIRHFLNGNAQQ